MIFRYQWSSLELCFCFCFLLAASLLFLAVQFSSVFGWTGISCTTLFTPRVVPSTLQLPLWPSENNLAPSVQVFTQPGCEQGQVMPDDPSNVRDLKLIAGQCLACMSVSCGDSCLLTSCVPFVKQTWVCSYIQR